MALVAASALALTVLALALTAVPAAAQRPRLAEGRVLKPGSGRPVPVPAQWIVLHRVGTDRAGPLDSVRSSRDGRFRFRYHTSGDPNALYFISARYDGIAYFSPPLRADTVSGDDADVIVYDTTTDRSALHVQGRHFVLSAPRGTRREVAEVFELENDGTRTLVSRDSVSPLWAVPLPARAESASVAPGDVTAGAVTFRAGRAEVYAPVSPGVRQLVLMYQLPADALPLSIPITEPVSVLEVLLEEPRASVDGAQLEEVAPGLIEGQQFRRFLARDVPAASVMRITAPAPVAQSRGAMRVVALLVALSMAVAFIVWLARRGTFVGQGPEAADTAAPGVQPHVQPFVPPHAADVDRMVAELATLDARFERSAPTDASRAEYERRRAELKARLERALAGGQSAV